MTAIVFLTAAFALQGIVESSVEGVAGMESVQGQERPAVPRSGDVLGLPEKPRVEDSFFDKTLFVGDSITIKLEWYVTEMRRNGQPDLLGNSLFFCSGGLAIADLLDPVSKKSVHPSIKGKKMLLEDAVALSHAERIYIMLGMNDIAVFDVQGSVDIMMELLGRIRKKSPNVQIFIESATPRLSTKDQKRLNNANLIKYNQRLCETLQRSGLPSIWFVDVASALRGEDGALPLEYCSDPEELGIHFTDEACQIWIDYLYTHTP
jgi:hypothetical protein